MIEESGVGAGHGHDEQYDTQGTLDYATNIM
jgi:hypothetical protein